MSKNCTLEEIAGLLLKNERFVLCPHVSPDGDALGSTLALKMALEKAGKQVTVMVDDDVPKAFGFLPQLDSFVKPDVDNPVAADLLVVLDASSLDRIGKVAQAVKYNAMVNIDHHISNTQYADYLYLNTEAAATGEILCQLVEKLGITPDKDLSPAFIRLFIRTAVLSALPIQHRQLCARQQNCWNMAHARTKFRTRSERIPEPT